MEHPRYGKCGISWHITAFERVIQNENSEFVIDTEIFVSVLEDKTPQVSDVTTAIVSDNIKKYCDSHPDVKRCHIRSDNAGNYIPLY